MKLSQENGHIPFPRMEISHRGKGKEIRHLSFPVLVPTFASCTVLSHSPGSRLLSPNGHLHLQRVCWASYPICIPLGCFRVNNILCKGRKPEKESSGLGWRSSRNASDTAFWTGMNFASCDPENSPPASLACCGQSAHICQPWIPSTFSVSMNRSFGYQTIITKKL